MSSISVLDAGRAVAGSQHIVRGTYRGDRIFSVAVTVFAVGIPLLLVAIVLLMVLDALPSITRYGFGFLTSSTWDPATEQFGAAAFIYGTVVTSIVALLLAAPVGVGCALFLAEYAPLWVRGPIGFVIELLAAIPSVIYGLWGLFVLAPLMGRNLLVAAVILAIMILPTVAAVSREVLLAVPNTQRDSMLALGATRWETVQVAVLPYARAGIAGAAVLGLARALGETIAVAMVIGNSSTRISGSLFTPGYTMASAIADHFTDANSSIYFSALVEVALGLLLVAAIMTVLARVLVWSVARGPAGTAVGAETR